MAGRGSGGYTPPKGGNHIIHRGLAAGLVIAALGVCAIPVKNRLAETLTMVSLSGQLLDVSCTLSPGGAAGARCARHLQGEGAAAAFLSSNGLMYLLVGNRKDIESRTRHHERGLSRVTVLGTLSKGDGLRVIALQKVMDGDSAAPLPRRL